MSSPIEWSFLTFSTLCFQVPALHAARAGAGVPDPRHRPPLQHRPPLPLLQGARGVQQSPRLGRMEPDTVLAVAGRPPRRGCQAAVVTGDPGVVRGRDEGEGREELRVPVQYHAAGVGEGVAEGGWKLSI